MTPSSGHRRFQEEDWTKFYVRVTNPSTPLFTAEKEALLPEVLRTPVVRFLEDVLQRQPAARPTIHELAERFDQLRAQLGELKLDSPPGAR